MGIDKDTNVGTASPVSEETAEVGSIRELKSLHVDGLDPVFEHQARLVNHAVQVIGMGKVIHRDATREMRVDIFSTNGPCSSSVDMVGYVIRYILETPLRHDTS